MVSTLCVFSAGQKDNFFSYAFVTMSALMWLLSRVFSGAVPKDFLQQSNLRKDCIYTAFRMYVFSGAQFVTISAFIWFILFVSSLVDKQTIC